MRKLAAIMFTDIEGFTALMQKDEVLAVELIDRHMQIYNQQVQLHEGQTIKLMGDGTLTMFHSALQAVRCAVAMQQAFRKEPLIPVRVGIHLGDVILKENDVFGDAVNLSSRIQTAGVAGSVLVSEKVCDELANHPDIPTVPLGYIRLKNVHQEVRLFAVAANGLVVPVVDALPVQSQKTNGRMANEEPVFWGIGKKKALYLFALLLIALVAFFIFRKPVVSASAKGRDVIAIIPFRGMSSAGQENYFAYGLTQELISLLSANSDFKIRKVSADSNSVLSPAAFPGALKEMGESSILEGSVQHERDSLIVFVDLRDPATDELTWTGRYSIGYGNPLSMQYDLAQTIFTGLLNKYEKASTPTVPHGRLPDSLAYVYYMQGNFVLNKRTDASMQEAIVLFNKATQRDPLFAKAFSGIGVAYTLLFDNGYRQYYSGIDSAREALNLAFALDSNSAEVRASRALFFSSVEGKRAEAMRELKIALRLDPHYTAAHQWYALELTAAGAFDSALVHINIALENEPYAERLLANKFMILRFARRFREMISAQNAMVPQLKDVFFLNQRIESFYWLNECDSALYYARLVKDSYFDYGFWEAICKSDRAKLQNHLRLQTELAAAQNSTLDYETKAIYYVYLSQYDRAIDELERAYENREFSWLKFLNVRPLWDPLRNSPRFQALLMKMGFAPSSKNG